MIPIPVRNGPHITVQITGKHNLPQTNKSYYWLVSLTILKLPNAFLLIVKCITACIPRKFRTFVVFGPTRSILNAPLHPIPSTRERLSTNSPGGCIRTSFPTEGLQPLGQLLTRPTSILVLLIAKWRTRGQSRCTLRLLTPLHMVWKGWKVVSPRVILSELTLLVRYTLL